MQKTLIPLLASSLLTVGSLSAATLINESFDYGLADGTVVNDGTIAGWGNGFGAADAAFSVSDLDGVGGSIFTGTAGPFITLAQANTGNEAVNFEFMLGGGSSNLSGRRVMMETVGSNSSAGFGINFNYNATSEQFTVWARVGSTHNNSFSTDLGSTTVRIYGSYNYDTVSGLGSVTVNYDSIVSASTLSVSQLDSSYNTLGNDVAFRSGDYLIDGLVLETPLGAPIPEPSTYAAIAGLLALGFVAYRRRGR